MEAEDEDDYIDQEIDATNDSDHHMYPVPIGMFRKVSLTLSTLSGLFHLLFWVDFSRL